MKKIVVVILIMLLIGCLGRNAYAYQYRENIAKRFFLGIISGGILPEDSDIDDTWYVGGNFAYGINEYVALGAEVGYTSWEDKEEGVDYGDVQAVPLLADLYLRYPIDLEGNMFVPYLVGGVGVIFWDYEESTLLQDNNITLDMDSELGIKAGGGFDYFFTDNFALNFESSYVWSDADVSATAFGAYAATTIDTDYWTVSGGFKYYFD